MSHGGDLFALGENVASEPVFTINFRGSDKAQVDDYVTRVEGEVATLSAEREEALAQIQALAAQMQGLQMEIAELRRHAVTGGHISFRHLGPRVEQILALAEDQAEAIRAGAVQEIAHRRSEAEQLLREAR